MNWRVLVSISVAATTFVGSNAHAAWHVAQSKHFIIYADQKPDDLRDFATRLERFDKAVRHSRKMDDPPVGDGNRLTVFVLSTDQAVRDLAGSKGSFLRGFYKGSAEGPVAYVPRRVGNEAQGGMTSEIVFFHEYAHHLMMQAIDRPLPEWVIEGFAEFLSTVRFEKDGTIGLGAPAQHRAYGLLEGDPLALETMLGGKYEKLTVSQMESIYGRGWLLTHYLTFEPARSGQMERYVDLINRGSNPVDAARAAFGDLKQLDRDLRNYLTRTRLKYLKVAADRTQPGPIDVQPLSGAAARIVPLRARIMNGVAEKDAPALADAVRAIASGAPGDLLAQITLAQAELAAKRYSAAEDAAKRAALADPKSARALVYQGQAMMKRADSLDDPDQAKPLFESARKLFAAGNQRDVEDPLPLIEFYRSYAKQGLRPTTTATKGFHYASDLAPQDLGLRMNSAMLWLQDGNLAEARRTLAPIAYDPHGHSLARVARRVIERIDSGGSRDDVLKALSEE
jgi:hypothetical protein